MRINVFLDAGGQEKIVKGEKPSTYDMVVRLAPGEGVQEWYTAGPKNGVIIAQNIEATLPGTGAATVAAVRHLQQARQEVLANAAVVAAEHLERINNLLALGYSPVISEVPNTPEI